MADDPYTAAVEGLWALLESKEYFTDLVGESNRIKFTGANRAPVKAVAGEGDLIEVRILPASSEPHAERTSSGESEHVTFEIQVATGDQRIDARIFPVHWAITRALNDVSAYLIANVTFSGNSVVMDAEVESGRFGVSQADLNRGIKGWSAIHSIRVKLWHANAWL